MKKCSRSSRICITVFMLLITALLPTVSLATEPMGNITVKLNAAHYDHAVVSDVAITIWLVADFVEKNYVFVPEYAGCDVDLNNLDTAKKQLEAAKNLILFIKQNQLQGMQQITSSTGDTMFADLSAGLYLLQVADAFGTDIRLVTDPFLVSVPLWNPDESSWAYNVIAEPKSTAYTDDTPPPDEKPTPPPDEKPTPPPDEKPTPPPDEKPTPPPDEKPTPPPDEKPISPLPEEDPDIPPGENLPQTGQHALDMWVFYAIGFLLIALGAISLYQGRKYEKK